MRPFYSALRKTGGDNQPLLAVFSDRLGASLRRSVQPGKMEADGPGPVSSPGSAQAGRAMPVRRCERGTDKLRLARQRSRFSTLAIRPERGAQSKPRF